MLTSARGTDAPLRVTPPSQHAEEWARLLQQEAPVCPADVLGVARGDVVLAVVAHPDDETLAMGATLAELARSGVVVELVVLTAGEAALDHLGRSVDGLAARRLAELRVACRELGVHLEEIGTWPDGQLSAAGAEVEDRLGEVAERLEPRAVITLWADDPHPDHRAAALAAQAVARATGVPVVSMPLWAVHWTDPAEVSTVVRRFHVGEVAVQARDRALAAYTSQTVPLAADLEPVLPTAVVSWSYECVVLP